MKNIVRYGNAPGTGYFITDPEKYVKRDQELRFATAKKVANLVRSAFSQVGKLFSQLKSKISSFIEDTMPSIRRPSIFEYIRYQDKDGKLKTGYKIVFMMKQRFANPFKREP